MDVKLLVNWIRSTFQSISSRTRRVAPRTSKNILESQKDWGRKGPPTPLPRPGYEELFAQDCVQLASEYLQGQRFYNLPGQPLPELGHSHSKKKFPDVQRELSACQFVPVFVVKIVENQTLQGMCTMPILFRQQQGETLLARLVPASKQSLCLAVYFLLKVNSLVISS